MMLIPVAGAVIGGAIAGPVGLFAGMKVGKIAAVSGGLLGQYVELCPWHSNPLLSSYINFYPLFPL